MADIILRVIFEGSTYDLDIDGNVPLRLDVSAVENDRIGSFFGVGSQTFDLPGTKNNNRFFKHAYDIGVEDVPAFYNTIQAYVIYNGETLLEGQILLLEAITDQDGFVVYKVQLSDTVIQFKDAISNKLISQANWSAYDHTLTSASIVDSWSDNLLSGSIFYPLCDFGADSKADWPALPRVSTGTTDGYITTGSTPMQAKQFLPAVKVKDTLDVIFDQVGFSYTGSFVTGSSFENLYILPKATENLGAGDAVYNGLDLSQVGTIPTMTSAVIYPLNWSGIIIDPGNNFNPATDLYTAPIDGKYSMSATFNFLFNPVTAANSPVDFRLVFTINGATAGDEANQVLSTGQFQQPMAIPTQTFDLNAGDTVALTLTSFFIGSNVNSFAANATWNIPNSSAPTTYEGVAVNMANQWDAQTKSLDILKGLIDQFNLVLTPVYRQNNLISIDTFDTWMSQGSSVDWTDKFETAIRVGIKHTVSEQQRELRFANVDDSDRFSQIAIEDTPNFQYGTLRILSDNNISQGEKKIGTLFGPTVLGSQTQSGSVDAEGNPTFNLDLASPFVFPHLYKFNNAEQKAYRFKPRIGYKVTNGLPENIFIGLPASSLEVSGSYSTIANIGEIPLVPGVTDDLLFNNTYVPFAGGITVTGGKTAYEKYWKTYTESLYWEGSRKLTIDIQFDKEEYKNIRLNDIIFIKDQQYRINKISGFNISSNDIANVELIRLYPAYYQGVAPYVPPTTTTTTSTSTTTSTTTAPTTTTSTSTTTSTTTLPTTTTSTSTTTSTTTLPTTTTSTSTTTSTTTLPTTTTSTSTTTSTTTLACACITVDVLNTQLTSGGLDLYYILNSCGAGATDINLAITLGTVQGSSTYFGFCNTGTQSNQFKYGAGGAPFVGLPGMNVNGNATVCTVDGDCLPVTPTTTTTTSTTTTTTTLPTTTSTSTTTTTTTIDPYTYYFATACDGTPGTVYFRSVTAYTPGEAVQIDTYGTTCYEVGASGAPINANNVIAAYPDCTACNPPTTTTSTTTTTTTVPTTTTSTTTTTTTADPYNYYYMEGCPGTIYDGLDRVVRTTASFAVSLDPNSASSVSIFGTCFYAKSTTTKAIYDACSPSDLSCVDVTGFTMYIGCDNCNPPTTTTTTTTTSTSTTTTTTTLAGCTQFFTSLTGDASACISLDYGTSRRHNGALPDPTIGDRIFTEATCTTAFNGSGLWYNVLGDTSSIRIDSGGYVTNKLFC